MVEKSLSPEWEETFEFAVKEHSRMLHIEVIDYDVVNDDVMGFVSIKLENLIHRKRVRIKECKGCSLVCFTEFRFFVFGHFSFKCSLTRLRVECVERCVSCRVMCTNHRYHERVNERWRFAIVVVGAGSDVVVCLFVGAGVVLVGTGGACRCLIVFDAWRCYCCLVLLFVSVGHVDGACSRCSCVLFSFLRCPRTCSLQYVRYYYKRVYRHLSNNVT